MNTLPDVIAIVQSDSVTPGQLSKCALWMAGHYAYLGQQLTEVLARLYGDCGGTAPHVRVSR